MNTARDIGFNKEKEAVKFLKNNGYKILETNFRTPFGEIDIIAKRKNEISFIEVKYRKTLSGGTPCEAVNRSKQQKIIKSALFYIKRENLNNDFTFDVVSILDDDIEFIKSAFSPAEGQYYI